VVAGLFLPGLVVYFILRPANTLEEEYQRSLEEETLLRSLEERSLCPGCSRQIEKSWLVCPDCQTRLKKACHHCGKLMELHWNICPHCATPSPGMRKEGITMDEALRPTPAEILDEE
jgi:RNA polymerase subunit RPABC4/transcription elongation factor Spt4